MSSRVDAVTGSCLVVVGALASVAALGMPPAASLSADASLMAKAVGGGLVLVGLGLAAPALLRSGREAQEDRHDGFDGGEGIPLDLPVDVPDDLLAEQRAASEQRPAVRDTAVLLVAVVAYAYLAFALGYVISTLVFVVLAAVMLGYARSSVERIATAGFALLVAAVTYVGLFLLLGVRPPQGPLL